MNNKNTSFEYDKSDSTELLSDLAGILSHDVRTPVRHISQFLDFFEKERKAGNDDAAEAYLAIVRENIGLASDMINGLISYLRLGRGLDAPSALNLKEISETALDRIMLALNCKDVSFHYEGVESVFGHRVLLENMLTYLIENAIMFAPENIVPTISIHAEDQDQITVISVSDDGPGIRRGYERIIFDLFQSGVKGKAGQGNGMGLAYCRRIAEVHGGHIDVADPLNSGSGGACFIIRLPHAVQD